jgi:hypothetical protein
LFVRSGGDEERTFSDVDGRSGGGLSPGPRGPKGLPALPPLPAETPLEMSPTWRWRPCLKPASPTFGYRRDSLFRSFLQPISPAGTGWPGEARLPSIPAFSARKIGRTKRTKRSATTSRGSGRGPSRRGRFRFSPSLRRSDEVAAFRWRRYKKFLSVIYSFL